MKPWRSLLSSATPTSSTASRCICQGNSITSALANEFAEAETGLHVAALMELGLILFVITFIVLAASKFMIMRLAKNEGHANGDH